jgi:hypothetical protein
MKLELGKLYRTKSKHLVKLISKRNIPHENTSYYLGIIEGGLPETFWYAETGRMYNDAISPYDIEREIRRKVEFKTNIEMFNGEISINLPAKEDVSDLIGQKVKVTIELIV